MSYELLNVSNHTTGILSLTQNVNDQLMFGWLGTLFLIGITIIIFTSFIFSTNDVKKSVAATSFLSFALALFLRAVNLVPDMAIFTTLVCAAVALAFAWKKG